MGKPEALKGIRWLSTTMYIFTPHSVANLAELGAEVIKVEMPRMGDPMKHTSPFNEAYLYPAARHPAHDRHRLRLHERQRQ